MEESSQNVKKINNNDEIYLNNVVMEEELEIQPSIQTKKYINANEVEERIKNNF
jgi:hypothetical protein